MNRNRQPEGIPTGGQFAAERKSDDVVALNGTTPAAGTLTVQELESVTSSFGQYDAYDWPGYGPAMQKVFAIAREHTEATPAGMREAALRNKAKHLHDILGLSPKDIRDFHDEISGAEPGSEGWESIVQTYAEHYFNEPRGTAVYVESQMREAGKPVTERAALVAERNKLQARIDALDINTAAAGVRTRFPAATSISAMTTGEDDGSLRVAVYAADGAKLWSGDPDDEDDPLEIEGLNLVPDKYAAGTSPLRHCTTDNDAVWIRRYDLGKMSALTAEQITGEKKR